MAATVTVAFCIVPLMHDMLIELLKIHGFSDPKEFNTLKFIQKQVAFVYVKCTCTRPFRTGYLTIYTTSNKCPMLKQWPGHAHPQIL